jgi:hypothetical protein
MQRLRAEMIQQSREGIAQLQSASPTQAGRGRSERYGRQNFMTAE